MTYVCQVLYAKICVQNREKGKIMTNFEIYVERMGLERKARKEKEYDALLLNGLQTRTKEETYALLVALSRSLAPAFSFGVEKELAKA